MLEIEQSTLARTYGADKPHQEWSEELYDYSRAENSTQNTPMGMTVIHREVEGKGAALSFSCCGWSSPIVTQVYGCRVESCLF